MESVMWCWKDLSLDNEIENFNRWISAVLMISSVFFIIIIILLFYSLFFCDRSHKIYSDPLYSNTTVVM